VKTLSFLIEYLHPDFLIIDDVDKMDMTKGLPTLLDILQRFKTEHSFVSIIMTANSVSLFDKGFLRPGRIDTWIEFKIPNDEERAAILTSYIKEEGITVSDEMIKDITTITSGLAQDYLREIVTCLKHDDGADIMKSIELMKSLLEVKGSEKPACASTNTSPQPDLLCCTKS
jgi:SpoVK/Ycf46/Vps4 family AAA+-type ATPase